MSVAYVVLAHRYPDQLGRLCRRLAIGGHSIVVHLDRRVELRDFRPAAELTAGGTGITWVQDRVSCRWGHYSLVEAALRGARTALRTAPQATHVVLLSGQCYPVKPAAQVAEFFERSPRTSFLFSSSATSPGGDPVEGNSVWPWADWKLVRMRRWHQEVRGRWVGLPNRLVPWWPERTPPGGMRHLQGSQWWALHRAAMVDVLRTFEDPRVPRFFRHVQIPDENAVQMVLDTTEHAQAVVQDDLHYISWRRDHPRDLCVEDVPVLAASQKIFARKFAGPAPLDALDALHA